MAYSMYSTQHHGKRHFKTNAAKRHNHNVDLSDDDMQNSLPYGWMASYNQRALVARILYNSENQSQSVKFITREEKSYEGPGYNCNHPDLLFSLDGFYKVVSSHLKTFEESKINSDYWNEIVKCIELSEFKYEKKDKVDCWTSSTHKTNKPFSEKYAKLSGGQKLYLSAFGAAMKCDMRNGRAKEWMSVLIQTLFDCTDDLSKFELRVLFPSRYCGTNTMVETIWGDLDSPFTQVQYNAPFSSTPLSMLSLSSLSIDSSVISEASSEHAQDGTVDRHTIIPDFCVVLSEFPGRFPLVVELKPALKESKGLNQNLHQMLSKLFFQEVVFGIVVSPRFCQLSVIIKKQGDLHFASTTPIPLFTVNDDGMKVLDLVVLDTMCTYIYRVLKWTQKTKCLLKTQGSLEGTSEPPDFTYK